MQGALGARRLGPVAVALAAAVAVNLVVQALGLEGEAADPDPPGWLIGGVWTALFACFGAAYAALARAPGETGRRRAALVGLGAVCLAYPFYTAGFEATAVALAATLATAAYAAGLVAWFRPASRSAALWVAPVLPWLAFAAWMLV